MKDAKRFYRILNNFPRDDFEDANREDLGGAHRRDFSAPAAGAARRRESNAQRLRRVL